MSKFFCEQEAYFDDLYNANFSFHSLTEPSNSTDIYPCNQFSSPVYGLENIDVMHPHNPPKGMVSLIH